MGAWGTGISSNDTYADIYGQFIDLYNEGFTVPEITKRLIDENDETISIVEDAPNFWFAIANGQWECKDLKEEIFSKVEYLINSGEDIRIWKELEASLADIKSREKALEKFLSKLKTEKDKPRKRTKKKFYNSVYQKGDCLTYLMDNGNYGGAFVLTDEQQTETGTNYIAITTIDKPIKPTLDDFKSAEVYLKRVNEISFSQTVMKENWVDQAQIGGFSAMLKKKDVEIEIVGKLQIYKEYEVRRDIIVGFGWIALKSKIPFKDEYLKINGHPKTKLKLSEWTKKHWL
ncbi:hypothetical protein [Flavobacterium sp. GT3R68]|uniref:hypothetical protein n=1 Tax=Flavobacterium sp. GT3R68 TaxID=2594437 RepID=UPI000F87AFC2|nr:hypothetical protein [Flavobacterium sp. GT3R68]RTY85668.1 hypothetical protein EKL32_28390 [Flavobacterium sp. GSN2]TRW89338.1 hypothetical protein FNW07_13530 [Flavobacterium sp. GT3R68]